MSSSGHASPRPLLSGRRHPGRTPRNRTVIVAVLLAVAGAGAGASGRSVAEHGPLHHYGGPVAAGLELVLAALLLWLRSIRLGEPEPGYLTARVRLFLHRTIIAAMIVVACVVVSTLVWPGLRKFDASPLSATNLAASGLPATPFRQFTRAEAELIVAGLTLLVLAAIATVVVLLRRMAVRPSHDERPIEDDRGLRQAVDSGLRALQSVDDARAAIIACYLSMEASLSAAGAARDHAETSAELLHRAVRAGLLHVPAASQLTGLFYEARYSSHELPARARKDAMAALLSISADLEAGASVSGQARAAAPAAVADA